MNFDFENYVFPPLKVLGILLLGTTVASFIWLQFSSVLFGQLMGQVLSPLVPFFSSHDMVYHMVQKVLIALYLVFVTAGIDFIFFGLMYILLNKIASHLTQGENRVWVSLRAVGTLLKWQALVGVVVAISLCWAQSFSVLWLVPSFLSASLLSSIYTVCWEIFFLVLSVGFVLTKTSRGVLRQGGKILLDYMPIWMVFASISVFISWAPAVFVSVNTPSWVLLLIGLMQHVLLCVCMLIFLFNQPALVGAHPAAVPNRP